MTNRQMAHRSLFNGLWFGALGSFLIWFGGILGSLIGGLYFLISIACLNEWRKL